MLVPAAGDEWDDAVSRRDFFQICSVGETTSRSAVLRFPSGDDTGGGCDRVCAKGCVRDWERCDCVRESGSSSSSESKVRSMTSESCVCDRGGLLAKLAQDAFADL